MNTQTDKATLHFNAYYHDNTLLIQLVIVEFINSYYLIKHLKTIKDKCFNNKNSHISLSEILIKLLGITPQDSFGNPTWNTGTLTKLKTYSAQFIRNNVESLPNKLEFSLYSNTQQAWLYALQSLEFLNGYPMVYSSTLIEKSFSRLFRRFLDVNNLLRRLIKSYADKENVAFFLLRKQAELEEIYGDNFLSKIVKKYE